MRGFLQEVVSRRTRRSMRPWDFLTRRCAWGMQGMALRLGLGTQTAALCENLGISDGH